MGYTDETVRFDFDDNRKKEISETLTIVYNALAEKGYNPINQIVGYLLSGDPAYIPRYQDARNLIRRHERDEVMEVLVKYYLTAQGVEIIRIDEEKGKFGFERLGELVKEYQVTKFVVGLPKNMNNSIGPRAEASMVYAEKIKELFDLPVEFQDERLTTVQAERMLVEQADVSRSKRKKVIDKLAAVMILQNYLDRTSNKL